MDSLFISYFTVGISTCSLIVAIIALVRTFIIDRKVNIKSRKAVIRAKGYKSGKSLIVKIINDGQSTAKNIRLIYDCSKKDGIRLIMDKNKFPYPLLNSGDSFEIGASLWGDPNPNPLIKFIWDDKYKKNNECVQILEF